MIKFNFEIPQIEKPSKLRKYLKEEFLKQIRANDFKPGTVLDITDLAARIIQLPLFAVTDSEMYNVSPSLYDLFKYYNLILRTKNLYAHMHFVATVEVQGRLGTIIQSYTRISVDFEDTKTEGAVLITKQTQKALRKLEAERLEREAIAEKEKAKAAKSKKTK